MKTANILDKLVFELFEIDDPLKVQKKREYNKKYYQKNKEKLNQRRNDWSKKNPERVRAWSKKWRQENPEKVKVYSKKWRDENPEKVKANSKKHYEIRKIDRSKLASVLYGKTLTSKRRKTGVLENNISTEYIQRILEKQNYCCALTGVELDHITGKNNLRMASVDRINSKKGYIKGNIQIVLNCINKFKGESSNKEVRDMLRQVAEGVRRWETH